MTEPPAEPDPLPVGHQIAGRYVIESELPPARMGRVYKARDVILNETVAVNVLAPRFRDDEGIGRFFLCFHRTYKRRRQALADGQEATMPILNLFSIDGTVGAVVAYVEGVGATLDIAEP